MLLKNTETTESTEKIYAENTQRTTKLTHYPKSKSLLPYFFFPHLCICMLVSRFNKLFVFFLLFPCILLEAQEIHQNSFWLSANAHYGFAIAHSPSMAYLVDGHCPGAELSICKTTSGEKQWQRAYNNPEIGISALYLYLSNPSQLGFGLSLHPYVNFPLIKKNRFGLNFKAAVSTGYLSKIFDPVINFKNSAIGSHFNGFVNLKLNVNHALGKNYRLEYGIGLSHFSNGAFKMPNLGINIPTFNIGLGYRLPENSNTTHFNDTSINAMAGSNKLEITFIAAGFKAQVQPPGGTNYAAFTISSSLDWKASQKHRFLVGAELGYNGGNIERLKVDTIFITKKSQMLQSGIKIGYALRIGNLELPAEFGFYTHTLLKSNGAYFHRIGVRYYFSNNLIANFTLKTHWAVADYWECGIGYVFKNKK